MRPTKKSAKLSSPTLNPDLIAASRDAGSVDHVAFTVGAFTDLPIPPAVQAPSALYPRRSKRTALLTAPVGLLIEVVEDR